MKLMTVETARAAMLALCPPLGNETVALADALGRVLAEDVIANRDQPPFAASAMDGWAVRAADGTGPAADHRRERRRPWLRGLDWRGRGGSYLYRRGGSPKAPTSW